MSEETGTLEDLPIKVQQLIAKLRQENRELRAERTQTRASLAAILAATKPDAKR